MPPRPRRLVGSSPAPTRVSPRQRQPTPADAPPLSPPATAKAAKSPDKKRARKRRRLIGDILKRTGVTAAVLAALGALVFNGVSSCATNSQLELARQGQITDRYSTDVDQPGSTSIEVRLGGICALERLMRDSPGDQPTIIEEPRLRPSDLILSSPRRERARQRGISADIGLSSERYQSSIFFADDVAA